MADFGHHLSEVLSCYFPDFDLKQEQRDVLKHLYEGRGDCLVSLPTGYGKSLLFQVAGPLLGRRNGVPNSSVLVLSPLNVIQRDQMLSMTKRGITCCRIDMNGRPWTYIQEPEEDLTGDQDQVLGARGQMDWIDSLDAQDVNVRPAVEPSSPQLIARLMDTQQLRDPPVDLLESLELQDAILCPVVEPSGPQYNTGPVETQETLERTVQVASIYSQDLTTQPEVEPCSPRLMETQQLIENENVDQVFVVTEDELCESWPLTALQGVVFQHDDITQVDSSLLDEDPMKVDTLDVDGAMWSPATLETISEPAVDGSLPHLCTASETDPQFHETEVSIEEVVAGKFTVILSHPEALLKEDGKRLLHSPAFGERIVALFVDECHTVEQWSNDFRTAYGKLHTLPAYFTCPIIGLSATITTASLEQLPLMMGMSSPLVIRVNPDKPNIFLERRTKPSNIDIEACAESIFKPFIDQLFEEGDDYPVTLLYMPVEWCSNAQLYACEKFGYPDLYTTPYVAIYSSQDTEVIEYATQELKSISPHIRLVFCTSSVGMGFDSPCISRVVHAKPPRNIVDYVQQIGRAGRVGQLSTAILFFNASDIARNVKGIKESIVHYCRTSGCLRQSMLEPFGFACSDSRSRCCSNCQ